MITLKEVNKKFKDIILFENLSIKIPDRKKILIKGVNGSGKSVFLKMIVGYSTPDSGEIIIDDYVLKKDRDFIDNAGVSINAPEFMKDLTGIENLMVLANIKKKVTKSEIMELVKTFGLEKNINKKYKTYSLGMKQKMRMIQAIMEKPKYLILDEPFDALDKKSQDVATKLLNKYVESGNTLIFTSHNSQYEKFADIIFEINDYKLKKVK